MTTVCILNYRLTCFQFNLFSNRDLASLASSFRFRFANYFRSNLSSIPLLGTAWSIDWGHKIEHSYKLPNAAPMLCISSLVSKLIYYQSIYTFNLDNLFVSKAYAKLKAKANCRTRFSSLSVGPEVVNWGSLDHIEGSGKAKGCLSNLDGHNKVAFWLARAFVGSSLFPPSPPHPYPPPPPLILTLILSLLTFPANVALTFSFSRTTGRPRMQILSTGWREIWKLAL